MNIGAARCPFQAPAVVMPSQLQVVDYEKTQQQLDPTAAPQKQAKVAMDSAVLSGDIAQLESVLRQIQQHIPEHASLLMMHALRTAGKHGDVGIMQFLLDQIGSLSPQQLYELMKYALDGAAMQGDPAMMHFLLGAVQKAFHTSYPQQFLELVQHAVNDVAYQGNLRLLKFLMDHTTAAAIPINYDSVFSQAVAAGHAETLLKSSIDGGELYENVILMLLQSVKNLPANNDSHVGSRQSFKNTAKIQVVKSYKQKDPALFAKLMAAIKSFFPEEADAAARAAGCDVTM